MHHELGQDARRYDCMDAGGRATQELKPRTMQEQLTGHEEHEDIILVLVLDKMLKSNSLSFTKLHINI